MSKNIHLFAVIVLSGVLAACIGSKSTAGGAAMTPKEQEAVAALNWLDKADAKADALAAIASGKTSLLTMGGRGGAIPGIPLEKSSKYVDACGAIVTPGATDVVHGDTQLSYLQRAYEYAEQYNKIVAKHCAGD